MAYTAEQLVQLLKGTDNLLNLAGALPQFRDGLDNLVSRLQKAEKAVADQAKRITTLEAAQKAAKPVG
jgi:hypothetical protein